MKLHVFGASGSGVTTLGKALAEKYHLLCLDADDFYWQQTDPPYTHKNPIPIRWHHMETALQGVEDWVISGSMDSWADPLVEMFDLAIFLQVPNDVCVRRIIERERLRHGARILPGGDMYEQSREFIEWARHYEDNTREGRNRARHEAWLKTLPCPVLRLGGENTVTGILECVNTKLRESRLT